MSLPLSLLMALVMLGSNPACSLCCDLPVNRDNQESFTVLSQMQKISLVSCLGDRTDFRLPQILAGMTQLEKTQAAVVLHGMLQQIFNFFSTSSSHAAWDEILLDNFLTGIYQQLEDLELCLEKGRKVEQISVESENSRLAVKKYFQGLRLYLKEKAHSHCAWEIVRVETRRCLLFITKFTETLRT
ncbi:interferon alpha-2-like [Echinops telfairi]|uniref:Interferon alpha-2-like n=1 Tax=Echinops telfairi TaxID=9371 RepID=A0ABM0ISD8_ECHTE|nr:interferon alpha-2-like [Echinops telfairi]